MKAIQISPSIIPPLDKEFVPAVLWNRAYTKLVEADPAATPLTLALERGDADISIHEMTVLSQKPENDLLSIRYLERTIKFLLWQQGARRIHISGRPDLVATIREIYSSNGERQFDFHFIGGRIYEKPLEIIACNSVPVARNKQASLGRNFKGCRIGFDLGGSARKCAAIIDGEVIFSEEIAWNPYFQTDPQYHYDGIQDSLLRAAKYLPRVDAIGGSSAGTYVDNEVRVASLFRGIEQNAFKREIRPIFKKLRQVWKNIPFEVINDGEVTALAGAISLNDNSVLGVSLGTSQAGGFVNAQGNLTTWLNELAFVPVDYSPNAARDEWSGDIGCGVQYFSQQAVARLASKAGLSFAADVPFAERLLSVQALMRKGDERTKSIYETIGVYLGYTMAHYHDFYQFKHFLLLGGVTSGEGGEILLVKAKQVLSAEFPEIYSTINVITLDEKQKRQGQAIAAASLPSLF